MSCTSNLMRSYPRLLSSNISSVGVPSQTTESLKQEEKSLQKNYDELRKKILPLEARRAALYLQLNSPNKNLNPDKGVTYPHPKLLPKVNQEPCGEAEADEPECRLPQCKSRLAALLLEREALRRERDTCLFHHRHDQS